MLTVFDAPETVTDDEPVAASPEENTLAEVLADESDEPAEEATSEAESRFEQPTAAKRPKWIPENVAESEADVAFWRELVLIGKLAEVNRQIEEAECRIEALKEEAKAARDHAKLLTVKMRSLVDQLAELTASDVADAEAVEAEAVSQAEESGQGDDAWRQTDTADLCGEIKGMGAKKLDALIAAAPTAGDLEDLRGEASRAHQSFSEVLPKGFGQAIADAIENALLAHVTS